MQNYWIESKEMLWQKSSWFRGEWSYWAISWSFIICLKNVLILPSWEILKILFGLGKYGPLDAIRIIPGSSTDFSVGMAQRNSWAICSSVFSFHTCFRITLIYPILKTFTGRDIFICCSSYLIVTQSISQVAHFLSICAIYFTCSWKFYLCYFISLLLYFYPWTFMFCTSFLFLVIYLTCTIYTYIHTHMGFNIAFMSLFSVLMA